MHDAGHSDAEPPAQQALTCCPVVELRQYTLHPGQRDVLIELFDREFVETQEAAGMRIIGQFRDLDDPDRFVWLRGFRDMPSRGRALTAFYGGPVWKAHREAARATMVDTTNALLLRPAPPAAGFALENGHRPPPGATEAPKGIITATICSFDALVDAGFLDLFERALGPALADAGASILASFVTESSANTYAPLPVREGENVFVWFAAFRSPDAHARHLRRLEQSPDWRQRIAPALRRRLKADPEVLRLAPTARSLLRA